MAWYIIYNRPHTIESVFTASCTEGSINFYDSSGALKATATPNSPISKISFNKGDYFICYSARGGSYYGANHNDGTAPIGEMGGHGTSRKITQDVTYDMVPGETIIEFSYWRQSGDGWPYYNIQFSGAENRWING